MQTKRCIGRLYDDGHWLGGCAVVGGRCTVRSELIRARCDICWYLCLEPIGRCQERLFKVDWNPRIDHDGYKRLRWRGLHIDLESLTGVEDSPIFRGCNSQLGLGRPASGQCAHQEIGSEER